MKLSIRRSIFLPVVIMLLSIPILTYIVFSTTASLFMEKQAKYDLMMLLKTIEPFVDYTFGEAVKNPTQTKEEQLILTQLQEATFFDETKPILQNGLNETRVLLLDQNQQLIYPTGGHFEESAKVVYEYCLVDSEILQESEMVHKRSIQDQQYFIGSIHKTHHSKSKVAYMIGYSIVPNTDKLLSRLSTLVFGITAVIAVIILPFIWNLANRISNPIKNLCNQAQAIGESNFRQNQEKSNLQEIKDLNKAMNEMAMRLENYDRAQKIFFENVSHELRTPLMSIRGYAEGIACNIFKETAYPAGIIIKESDKLATLVNQLLTLSRIDNAKQQVELQSIEIADFLKGRIEAFKPVAEQKAIQFILQAKKTHVIADEYLLESIVDNLFSNCLRYAQTVIYIRITSDGFMIEDDGQGFNKENLVHLFERFYKGQGGQTGLGLAIVKSSIEYMGGYIEAYNGKEKGAIFRLHFLKDKKD